MNVREEVTSDAVEPLLEGTRIRWRVHAYGSVASTNDTAKKLAADGLPEGALVVAETQTRGHGRRGNEWLSPPGGLWFSFVLRPYLPPERAGGISVITAVAVARAVSDLYGLAPRIKWPNDVFIAGGKLAGTMVSAAGGGALVVGVGINVNLRESEVPLLQWYRATSLLLETGHPVSRARLLAAALREFEERYFAYRAGESEHLLEEWRALSLVFGEEVAVELEGEEIAGTVFGLEDDGGLVVRLRDGRHRKIPPGGHVTLRVTGKEDSS